MTGNDKHLPILNFSPDCTTSQTYTTYKNGDDWGMVNMSMFYPHYMVSEWRLARNVRQEIHELLELFVAETVTYSSQQQWLVGGFKHSLWLSICWE